MLGPLPPEDSTGVITSRMDVVPKKVAGKWRVIVDLFSPHNGHSVNDILCCYLSHVSHTSTDEAAMLMHFLGFSALIAKVDIQDAYKSSVYVTFKNALTRLMLVCQFSN